MSDFQYPVKNQQGSEKESDRLVEIFKRSSRDHSATLLNDKMCTILADYWPAIDQALQQIQRDMAKPVGDESSHQNLNSIFVAFSQIHSRLLEFVDRGVALNQKIK